MKFLKNWKTTLAGAGLILGGVGGLVGAGPVVDPSVAVGQIVAGVGLILAGDAQGAKTDRR